MEIECTKCKETKDISKFSKRKNSKKGVNSWCGECYCRLAKTKHDGIYTVYYLPEEHYCGYTKALDRRINAHNAIGKNTDNMRILYACENHAEAIHHEAMFQSYLGMKGLISGRKD